MSPPTRAGRPGGFTTRTADKSNAKDYDQNTPQGYIGPGGPEADFLGWVAASGGDLERAKSAIFISRDYNQTLHRGAMDSLTERQEFMLYAAMWWAHSGWKIFPTRGSVPVIPYPHRDAAYDKVPCSGGCGSLGHGHKDATNEFRRVFVWWAEEYPGSDISAVTPENVLCLDVDPQHGGDEVLALLEAEHGALPLTMTVITGGHNGLHLYFRRCRGELMSGIGQGIEVKHVGVMPPSRHRDPAPECDGVYRLIDLPFADSPGWLLKRAIKPKRILRPKAGGTKFAGPSVIAEFNESHTWADILEPHGWTCVSGDGEGDFSRWRHDAATHESSASIREDADGEHSRIYVYTTNTPFEATSPGEPHGYDKFDAAVLLDFGGNAHALHRLLARNMFQAGKH
ncbi:hypothetical protein NGTWS0302_16800 [Mycolicibacterium cyprinidarum]|uniref:DNA primase/polymerase bifunctional N-terminal domain-containing protein n=1 Tax=Mycolicibacterium cyprinidarum TaxID=2860311 RepID=A0ABQ4VBC5_9MYCO|nr:hypothetical protein NGTWS1702_24750 [Mycolicibacterium sp. NGTWSNA01]GJF18514.1 hypothetical protein NGTWS0302_16800 [Mycolicibacterium sp. NGTWS0302]